MMIYSREVIGLRFMQPKFRDELGRKQGRKQQKSMLDFIGCPLQTVHFHSYTHLLSINPDFHIPYHSDLLHLSSFAGFVNITH
ncbi:hypothetical protein JG687_00007109 [Phytophthora cactorum]|uniref:Uncharacterized protein n=1 Tax=Phytophthora cactorum TaxID=29920 RepID=A0A8T1UG37_9STRA|nr:hypothetical protein JG687_00007109 [Phytophthora cactorum]